MRSDRGDHRTHPKGDVAGALRRAAAIALLSVAAAGCGPPRETTSSPSPPRGAESLLAEVRRLGNEGKTKESLEVAEKAVKLEPDNVDALRMATLANLLHSRELLEKDRPAADKLFFRAADLARRLRTAKPNLDDHERQLVNSAFYNEACAFALAGKTGQSLRSLEQALDAGYPYLNDIRKDADLKALHGSETFEKLMAGAAERIAAAKRRQALDEMKAFKPFKFDFALKDLDGNTVSLADFKNEVVIVDFWGTWCPPCRRELPHFVKLHEKYHEQGLQIVGVNYEDAPREEWAGRVKAFLEKVELPYVCVLGDDETQEKVPDLEVFPTTLFIDRTGQVRLKAEGYHDYEYLEAVVERLLLP